MKKILLFASLIIFIFSNYYLFAISLGQLKTEIRRNMHDTSVNASDQRYSDAYLLDIINEAQRDINNQAWLLTKTTYYRLLPNTTYYNLPNDVINVLQVKLNSTYGGTGNIDLDQTSRDALKRENPNWENFNGSPVEYYIQETTYSQATSSTNLQISYIPIPTVSSTGTVTIWYYAKFDDLVNDSDVPFNARLELTQYHYSIVYAATIRLKAIEGRMDEANFWAGMYNNYITTIKDRPFRMPNYKPGFNATPGPK